MVALASTYGLGAQIEQLIEENPDVVDQVITYGFESVLSDSDKCTLEFLTPLVITVEIWESL